MLKNISSLGAILNRAEQKSIKGGEFIDFGLCLPNCSVEGADCSLMFGPKKKCTRITCDSSSVLACIKVIS